MNLLYVLTRKDLRKSSPAVQAGHAVAEFLLKNPDTKWDNGTLIYLGVRNLHELRKWSHRLDNEDIKWVGFKEPDINNEMTALATVLDNNRFFSRLRLL